MLSRSNLFLSAAVVAAGVVLLTCNSRPSGYGATGLITGAVVKGPVSHATVRVFRLSQEAERLAQVAEVDTAEDGTFALELGLAEGPFLLAATGGSFEDEASAVTASLGTAEITAVIPSFIPGTHLSGVSVNPITHFAARLTAYYCATRQQAVPEAFATASNALDAHFGGVDWARATPKALVHEAATVLDDSAKEGLILAALSQEAYIISKAANLTPGASLTSMTLVSALAEDIGTDGVFDGMANGASLVLPQGRPVTSPGPTGTALEGLTLRTSLATAINDFLASDRSQSHFNLEDVRPLLDLLSRAQEGIFPPDNTTGYDTTPPALTVQATYLNDNGEWVPPVAGRFVRGRLHLKVRAEDSSMVSQLQLTLGQANYPLPPDDVNQPGSLSLLHEYTLEPGSYPEGELRIRIQVADNVGNSSNVVDTDFSADNTPPALTSSAPAQGQWYGQAVPLAASAEDNLGGAGVATLTAVGAGTPVDNSSAETSAYHATWSPSAEGEQNVEFRACDALGNCASLTTPVCVDLAAPVLSGLPSTTIYLDKTRTYTLTLHASDEFTSVARVMATLENPAQSIALPHSGPGDIWAAPLPFSTWDRTSSQSLYSVLLTATDAVGNVTAAAQPGSVLSFVVDILPPAIALDTQTPSYAPETTIGFVPGPSAPYTIPPQYTVPAAKTAVCPAPTTGCSGVDKIATRLSWGPAKPIGEQLLGQVPSSLNVPFLSFRIPVSGAEAPLARVWFSVQCLSPGVCDGITAGDAEMIPAPNNLWLLPVTREAIPGLASLPGTANLGFTVFATDRAGNSSQLSVSPIPVRILGPPLSFIEDTEYKSANDPRSAYPYHDGAYAALFAGNPNFSSGIRLIRYIVENPAPEPVAVSVTPPQGPSAFEALESWSDFTFENSSWSYTYGDSYCQLDRAGAPPCGWRGPFVDTYPTPTCLPSVPSTGPQFDDYPVAQTPLNVTASVLPSEVQAPTVGPGFLVPPATGDAPGRLAVYLTRPFVTRFNPWPGHPLPFTLDYYGTIYPSPAQPTYQVNQGEWYGWGGTDYCFEPPDFIQHNFEVYTSRSWVSYLASAKSQLHGGGSVSFQGVNPSATALVGEPHMQDGSLLHDRTIPHIGPPTR